MMTLDEARVLQKQKEKKSITRFLISTAVIIVLFFFAFKNTGLFSINYAIYLIPAVILLIAAKICGVDKFFTSKEFAGEVCDVHFYRITEPVSKGAGKGHGAHGVTHFEAELIVKNKKGRTMMKTFWGGDVTDHIAEGDEIAILRFVDEPVLIKGKYWTSSDR